MEDISKKQWATIKFLIATLLCVIIVFTGYIVLHPTSSSADNDLLKKELKRLNIELDSLVNNRRQLDSIESKIDRNITRINALDTSLLRQQKGYSDKIQYVKSQYEKTNRIDTFSVNSIQQYFSDEFGKR